jgi:hypothetical protein
VSWGNRHGCSREIDLEEMSLECRTIAGTSR